MSNHTDLCNLLLREVQMAHPAVRIFKRSVGMAFTANGLPVRFGLAGQCDVYGYIRHRPRAIPFEIEVKVGRDSVRADQALWHTLLADLGVPFMVLHATDKRDFKRACADAVQWIGGLR